VPVRAKSLAQSAKARCWAKIPIDPELARLCDNGDIEHYSGESIALLGKALATALKKDIDNP